MSFISHPKPTLDLNTDDLNELLNNEDIVNSPQHYISDSGIETIDVIEAFTKDHEPFEAYCTGNIIKYICRWKHKNGVEDLKKARWYINRLLGENEKIENDEAKILRDSEGHPLVISVFNNGKSKRILIDPLAPHFEWKEVRDSLDKYFAEITHAIMEEM